MCKIGKFGHFYLLFLEMNDLFADGMAVVGFDRGGFHGFECGKMESIYHLHKCHDTIIY